MVKKGTDEMVMAETLKVHGVHPGEKKMWGSSDKTGTITLREIKTWRCIS